MKRIDNNDGIGSTGTKVFQAIEEAILSGEFAPGDSLGEVRLSTELGVSRTPVREALRQLELEGLVKSVPNKGTVVVGITVKDIEDIYTIRMYIEGLSARWAAEKISPEELVQLRDIVELQEFYVAKGDILQVWHLDSRFHDLIHRSSRSNPLRHMLDSFHHYTQKARKHSFEIQGRARHSVQEHRLILEAIAAGDGDAAERLCTEHIRQAMENIKRNVQE